jgi:hypothetical protein
MVGSINDASYVVLGNTMSKTFPDLLAQTTADNKLPLKSSFIVDCVRHEALLDGNDYILEEYVPPKKKGRPSIVPAGKPKRKQMPKKVEKVAQIHHDGPPSPTPPPVSARVELPGGNFRFNEEEIVFFRDYAQHLVEMDYTISNTAIFKRLHEKVSLAVTSVLHWSLHVFQMPHHSITSWQSHIRRSFPDDLDIIRKKVGIARRKAADTGSSSQTNHSEARDKGGPSKRVKSGSSSAGEGMVIEDTVHQDSREQDFQDICRFFATSVGENSDDDVVWASLASRVS